MRIPERFEGIVLWSAFWLVVAGLIVLFIFVLSGSDVNEGIVLDKRHNDSWVQWIYVSDGKGGMTMTPIYYAEDYLLAVKSKDQSLHWVSVDQNLWSNIKIGDQWRRKGPR